MVTVTIDRKSIQVPEGTTIMEAAERAGIPVPHLCFLKDINEIAACRVCVVEVEGIDQGMGKPSFGCIFLQYTPFFEKFP